MQSSVQGYDCPQTTLGERRGKSDLDRFSLDLSWARGYSEGVRPGPYPSPPMSGSPPFSANKNPNFTDRGQGTLGSRPQDASSALPTPQTDPRLDSRAPSGYSQTIGSQGDHSHRHIQDQRPPPSYPSYQRYPEPPQRQPQYHYHAEQSLAQRPLQHNDSASSKATMGLYPGQQDSRDLFTANSYERPPSGESAKPPSPRAQRKPKGHVAAACVPCKRAHLRCDSSRPCTRCTSNGKEDACIDTQHKKRGRPRLREDRDRFDGMGFAYPTMDSNIRRPLQTYGIAAENEAGAYDQGYRVLKSQGGPPQQPPSRYLDHASTADAGVYGGGPQYEAHHGPGEAPCAYLSMDLQLLRTNRAFEEAVGATVVGRRLFEVVGPSDLDKLYRLQRTLDEERHQREPNYLPPIYSRAEQERTIQNISMNPEDIRSYEANRQETMAFVGPQSQRSFQVRFGLQKFQSTFFVVLLLDMPLHPQPAAQYPSAPLYARESQQQYGYQLPAQYGPPPGPVSPYGQYQQPAYSDPRPRETVYRPVSAHANPGPAPPSSSPHQHGPPPPIPSYAQPFQPPVYGAQQSREIPRTQWPQAQTSLPPPSRQGQLQLPPIRTTTGPNATTPREERRLDIGGLLEDGSMQRNR